MTTLLKMLDLLHQVQIIFVYLPSINFLQLRWWFQKFLVFICIGHIFFKNDYLFLVFERKWSTNCHLFNVEGNLLILVYDHNIFPPSCFHLVLSFVMLCTLAHSFVIFGNTLIHPQVPCQTQKGSNYVKKWKQLELGAIPNFQH